MGPANRRIQLRLRLPCCPAVVVVRDRFNHLGRELFFPISRELAAHAGVVYLRDQQPESIVTAELHFASNHDFTNMARPSRPGTIPATCGFARIDRTKM